jgi:hypothetical protein
MAGASRAREAGRVSWDFGDDHDLRDYYGLPEDASDEEVEEYACAVVEDQLAQEQLEEEAIERASASQRLGLPLHRYKTAAMRAHSLGVSLDVESIKGWSTRIDRVVCASRRVDKERSSGAEHGPAWQEREQIVAQTQREFDAETQIIANRTVGFVIARARRERDPHHRREGDAPALASAREPRNRESRGRRVASGSPRGSPSRSSDDDSPSSSGLAPARAGSRA